MRKAKSNCVHVCIIKRRTLTQPSETPCPLFREIFLFWPMKRQNLVKLLPVLQRPLACSYMYIVKTGQATIRMNRQAVLERCRTSLQGESFTVLSTASLFSSIEASSVVFLSPSYEQKMPKYVLNLCDVDGKYRKNIGFPYWSQNRSDTVLKG